jgi:hypothetical protein
MQNMIDPHERPLLSNYIRVREAAIELKMSQATLYRHLSLKKMFDGEVPASDEEGDMIWAEDLLNKPEREDGCYCCKQATWWDQGDRRICGVCHPKPENTNKK